MRYAMRFHWKAQPAPPAAGRVLDLNARTVEAARAEALKRWERRPFGSRAKSYSVFDADGHLVLCHEPQGS